MPNSDSTLPADPPPAGGEPGAVEAWALAQAAQRLEDSIASGDDEQIMAAVRLNWRMWTIFQTELLDPASAVPAEVRNNILSLAQFVDKHTVAYVAAPDRAMLDVLISINRDLSASRPADPGRVDA